MARRDVKLIGSLVDYVLDIKPYHTKLREFASEIIFKDTFNVSILDDHHMQIFMQNMWSRDDLGCHALSTISEGTDADRYFKIPAAVWPHFSINEDDLPSLSEGVPESDDPFLTHPRTFHFPGSDWIPVPAIPIGYDVHLKGQTVKNQGIGNNLILNGRFEENTNEWTATNATLSIADGNLRVTNTSNTTGYASQSFRTVPGKTYVLYIDPVSGTGAGVYHLLNNDDIADSYVLSSTLTEHVFTARGTIATIRVNSGSNVNGVYFEWNDISCYEYAPGKSVYHFQYDIEIAVDSTLEDLYGFGNDYQVIMDGQDVTWRASRNDVVGAFDTDQFEDESYDTKTRSFTISGFTGQFIPSEKDYQVFPLLDTQANGWVAQFAFAMNRPNVEIWYTHTGRYRVPFHQGSRVYVEGRPMIFGSSYTVESSRDFIQFMRGRHPGSNDTISVNTMTVDRMFISETNPFDVNPEQNLNENWMPYTAAGYDEVNFEELPYDLGLPDSVRDYFTFKIDDTYPGRVSPVSFMNSTTTDGKATLTITEVNHTAMNGEIYMVYATGLWTFAVQQVAPFRGPVTYGQFKQPYSNGKISFIVDKTWTPFYMVPDINTYASYPHMYDVYKFKPVDPTDQMMNLDLITEHGVVNDPDTSADKIHKPVEFTNIGKVRKVIDNTSMTVGWIGVETYDMSINEVGVIVSDVYPGGPADLAGIVVGDVILSIGAFAITNTPDLLSHMDKFPSGSVVNLTILRGIQTQSIDLVIKNQVENLEYYQFVLNEIPKRGVYYELKIEQSGGLNPRVHAAIDDDVVITVLEDGNAFMYTSVYCSRNPNNPEITVIDTDPIDNGDPSQYVDEDYWDRDYVD